MFENVNEIQSLIENNPEVFDNFDIRRMVLMFVKMSEKIKHLELEIEDLRSNLPI